MADYKSSYTGEQIDAGIAKANTAVQPAGLSSALASKQDTLVSGVNIKTINDQSLLGSGNIVIQGGGGSGDFNVKVVDATNPDDWSEEDDGPSQAVLEDIVENQYQAVRLINVPMDEYGSTYELDMFLTGLIDSAENEYWAREYVKFDSGDEEEEDPPFMQCFSFEKQGESPAEMEVRQYELGGGSSSGDGVFFTTAELGGTYYDEISLPLYDLSVAIDNNQEVIVRINGSYGYKTRYFRISNLPANKTYISGPDVDCWTPTFRCIDKENEYYMEFDGYQSEAYVFKIYTGAQRFTPTAIDIDQNTITLDVDDYSYIFNNKPAKIALNLDEDSGEFWVDFNKVTEDFTSGSEVFMYTSNIIPISSDLYVFTFKIFMNSGNVETEIYANQLTTSVPV